MQISDTNNNSTLKSARNMHEISSEEFFTLCKKKMDANKKNLIILDLDGTIINNLPRQERIFSEKLKDAFKLREIPPNAKEKHSVFYNILESNGIDIGKNEEMKSRFLKNFLRNKYLKHDEIIFGSPEFIKKLLDYNFYIIILTGRHHKCMFSSMKQGTEKFLKENVVNLTHPHIKLVMKPNINYKDLEYKTHFVDRILKNPKYNFISIVDNESEIINSINKISKNSLNIRFNGAQSKKADFNGYTLARW